MLKSSRDSICSSCNGRRRRAFRLWDAMDRSSMIGRSVVGHVVLAAEDTHSIADGKCELNAKSSLPARRSVRKTPLERGRNEVAEERMGLGRLRFEFGVKLHCQKPGMVRPLHDLDDRAVGADSRSPPAPAPETPCDNRCSARTDAGAVRGSN